MLLPTLTLTLLGTLALGLWVYASAPSRSENRSFAVFTWLSSLWVLNDLSFWCLEVTTPDTWARLAFTLGLCLQLTFIRFAWVFPTPRTIPWRWAAPILTISAGAFALIGLGQPVLTSGAGADLALTFTPTTFVLGGWIYLLFAIGRASVLTRLRALPPEEAEQTRRQLRAVLLGPTVTGAVSTVVIVVLPLAGILTLLPYASLGIVIGASLHTFALLRDRLLRPRSVLDTERGVPVTGKLAIAVVAAVAVAVLAVLGAARLALGPQPGPAWARVYTLGPVLAAVPAMLLILYAQRAVTQPLRAISEAAHAVTHGDTSVRVDAPRTAGGAEDEVTLLARAFNAMVDRLEGDLLAERETAEALQRTERLAVAGSLAAGVAHEVNNPLAAISSLVQTARERSTASDDETRALLDDALAQIDRISLALSDMSNLARPPGAEQRPIELATVVTDTLRLLRYDKRFRTLDLVTDLPPEPLTLLGAPARLQQVLLNLLLNARDAVLALEAGPRRVVVRGGRRAKEVWLEVCDSGPGVSPEERERIFEAFHTTKAPGDGTGLGLAVCRDIARAHGGSLRVLEAPEGGACFRLTLPAERSEATP